MKDELRKSTLKRRNKLNAEFMEMSGHKVLEFLIDRGFLRNKIFLVYYSIKNELPVKEILAYLIRNGKKTCLPVINSEDKLISCEINDKSVLIAGKYKIPEPEEKLIVGPESLEVILVPGTVFDKKGNRVGYGKGYYDRFLAKTNALKIGVCYEFQLQAEEIAARTNDIAMDFIVTEKGIYEV